MFAERTEPETSKFSASALTTLKELSLWNCVAGDFSMFSTCFLHDESAPTLLSAGTAGTGAACFFADARCVFVLAAGAIGDAAKADPNDEATASAMIAARRKLLTEFSDGRRIVFMAHAVASVGPEAVRS